MAHALLYILGGRFVDVDVALGEVAQGKDVLLVVGSAWRSWLAIGDMRLREDLYCRARSCGTVDGRWVLIEIDTA